ncbi:hypothetical protein LPICM02_150010 [Pseudolactococcus piscium]|nr:hypothetical protein LPICM02_150010 [Lactococcus piscium]
MYNKTKNRIKKYIEFETNIILSFNFNNFNYRYNFNTTTSK